MRLRARKSSDLPERLQRALDAQALPTPGMESLASKPADPRGVPIAEIVVPPRKRGKRV